MQQLSPQTLSTWLLSHQPDPILLDVREPWEFDICHVEGAQLMPMSSLPTQNALLDKAADIVIICHHGVRSMHAGIFLEQQGFLHVYNLDGGIDQWAAQIDRAMPIY